MDDNEMLERIRATYEINDMESFAKAQHEMAAEDFVQEFPQSGERFRGRDRIDEMNASYGSQTGTTPSMKLRRILKPGEAWIVEGTIDYGDGIPVSVVSIIEMGPGGKMSRQTDYFANPFEAPAWRSEYAEKMEPAGAR